MQTSHHPVTGQMRKFVAHPQAARNRRGHIPIAQAAQKFVRGFPGRGGRRAGAAIGAPDQEIGGAGRQGGVGGAYRQHRAAAILALRGQRQPLACSLVIQAQVPPLAVGGILAVAGGGIVHVPPAKRRDLGKIRARLGAVDHEVDGTIRRLAVGHGAS